MMSNAMAHPTNKYAIVSFTSVVLITMMKTYQIPDLTLIHTNKLYAQKQKKNKKMYILPPILKRECNVGHSFIYSLLYQFY